MKRVHKHIQQSGELAFIDSSGNMDRHNYRVFLILTHSVAGGLPLGVLITPNEQMKTLIEGLKLYNSLLDSSCFYGRGQSGLQVFMTDDSASERSSLTAVYPEAILLLCIFHVLQAFWRYLWSSENGVMKNDRQHLFYFFKSMVYAETEEELFRIFNSIINDDVFNKYSKVKDHTIKLFERRNEWALCCRNDTPICGNNTNNFCEAGMRVLKDSVLFRTKAFNIHQLIDFITTRYDSHFQRRLEDIANNRFDYVKCSRYFPTLNNIDKEKVIPVAPHVYEVTSFSKADKSYTVNMLLCNCTCERGKYGGPCKHQSAVMMTHDESNLNVMPVTDVEMRKLLHYVATGIENIPQSWFLPLKSFMTEIKSAAPEIANTDLLDDERSDVVGTNTSKTSEDEQKIAQTYTELKETLTKIFEDCESRTNHLCQQQLSNL